MGDIDDIGELLGGTPRFDTHSPIDSTPPSTPNTPNSPIPIVTLMNSARRQEQLHHKTRIGRGEAEELADNTSWTGNLMTNRDISYTCALFFQPKVGTRKTFEDVDVDNGNDISTEEEEEEDDGDIEFPSPINPPPSPKEETKKPIEKQTADERDFICVYLVLYEGQDCKYYYHMIPPSQTKLVRVVDGSQTPDFIPKSCTVVENPLAEGEYNDLLNFCRRNHNLKYNIAMSAYVDSSTIQNTISFFNGIMCCFSSQSTQNHLVVKQKIPPTPNGERVTLTTKDTDGQFKIPSHNLLSTLTNGFRCILDPPQIIVQQTKPTIPGEEVLNTKLLHRKRPIKVIGKSSGKKSLSNTIDCYTKNVVSQVQFTNSFQLHVFTYVAYLGGFIQKSDFISNCSVGYNNLKTMYIVVNDYYQKDMNNSITV